MRVVIDDGFSTELPTGIGRYTQAIVHALQTHAPEVQLVHLHYARLEKLQPRVLRRMVYLAWLSTFYPWQPAARQTNVWHFTNYFPALSKPSGLRYVVTIYDLTALKPTHFYSPAYQLYVRAGIRLAAQIADCVLTPSYAVRQEILSLLKVPPERTKVCYVAPSLRSMPETEAQMRLLRLAPALAQSAPFVLFVGRLERRKNLVTLVQAFAILMESWPNLRLVLAGRPGMAWESIRAAIRGLNEKASQIHVLQNCADDDLRALYSRCVFFVLPSVDEGFGIPLVEAMNCGAPVLASDIASSREVCGDTARLVPPTLEGILEGANELLKYPDGRRSLAQSGQVRVQTEFTISQCASQLLKAYLAD